MTQRSDYTADPLKKALATGANMLVAHIDPVTPCISA